MKDIETMSCNFCGGNTIAVYDVPTSLIGATVYACDICGLLQSVYSDKNKKNKHTDKRISSGASWGNIRHGKSIRLQESLNILKPLFDAGEIDTILDIGSNRGSFVLYAVNNIDVSRVDAIEPDDSILYEYHSGKNLDRLNIYNQKFESFNSNIKYDLVYCCHTLEHVDDARSFLIKTIDSINDYGYLYIDVPSADVITYHKNMEEFFIDKHTFHFTASVLTNMLLSLGLNILHANDDGFNITILCRLEKKSEAINEKIRRYASTKDKNTKSSKQLADDINNISENKNILIYGASRIFDVLVTSGLNTKNIKYIVDDYLLNKVDSVAGVKLTSIDDVDLSSISTCIILARSSTDKIKENLALRNFNGKIITVG